MSTDAIVLLQEDHTVRHHIDEEEQEWFPLFRARLGRSQLHELGTRMLELRPDAPTSPTQPSALTKAVDSVLNGPRPRQPADRRPRHRPAASPRIRPA